MQGDGSFADDLMKAICEEFEFEGEPWFDASDLYSNGIEFIDDKDIQEFAEGWIVENERHTEATYCNYSMNSNNPPDDAIISYIDSEGSAAECVNAEKVEVEILETIYFYQDRNFCNFWLICKKDGDVFKLADYRHFIPLFKSEITEEDMYIISESSDIDLSEYIDID